LLPRTIGLTLLLWAAACGGAAEQGQPNVLWISLDTLRADRLSCYGNTRETSPAIDALAAEGVLFERALSSSSWTLPAHASMLSGLPISVHGACYKVHPEVRGTFVAESMRAAGYATGGFYAQKFLERGYFSLGFETWERAGSQIEQRRALREQWEAAHLAGDEKEKKRLLKEHHEHLERIRPEAGEGVDQVLAWLDENRRTDGERPFFLFVHVFDIHSPYAPPAPYDRMFDPDYEGDIERVVVRGQRPGPGEVPVPHPDEDPQGFQRALDLYDGEIAWVDSQIERLLTHLETLGVADDTLVVLTSDHGDEFFEHGQTGHSKTLLRESVHVPLVLRLPEALPRGLRVDEPVSIVDIAPTVLSLTGVESLAPLPGVDLARLARGEARQPRTVVSELIRAEALGDPSWQVSLYRRDEHVIVYQPGAEDARAVRYDLREDPLELGNGRPVDWSSEAGAALARELDELRESYRALRASARRNGAEVEALDAFDDGELAALGYGGRNVLADGDEERLCMEGCIWRSE
jgi:arylsulfatase A-like enzyme